MIRVLTAPKHDSGLVWMADHSVFLAGGISNCADWQKEAIELFEEEEFDHDITLVNPRRVEFNTEDQSVSANQIRWEHFYLAEVTTTMFWFPHETLCPITLFELGKLAAQEKDIFVGCDPKYARKFDVEMQLSLIESQKHVKVYDNLPDLVSAVATHIWSEIY